MRVEDITEQMLQIYFKQNNKQVQQQQQQQQQQQAGTELCQAQDQLASFKYKKLNVVRLANVGCLKNILGPNKFFVPKILVQNE